MERSLSDCFQHSLQWEVPWFLWREPVFFHDISRLSFRKMTESLPRTFENSMLSDRSDFDCKSVCSAQHSARGWWSPVAISFCRAGGSSWTVLYFPFPHLPLALFPFGPHSPLGRFLPAELWLSPWLDIYRNEKKKINCLLIERIHSCSWRQSRWD